MQRLSVQQIHASAPRIEAWVGAMAKPCTWRMMFGAVDENNTGAITPKWVGKILPRSSRGYASRRLELMPRLQRNMWHQQQNAFSVSREAGLAGNVLSRSEDGETRLLLYRVKCEGGSR